ncbi:calcium-binding protein [Spirosoma spitsbergense]|uniref:calcium-binding protein n=1 Tax=Spirosoma spitsbergense TaxID=431554 RepID=UPI00037CC7E9|nr:calcium-binding protein [Spirosoma spitsbergense]
MLTDDEMQYKIDYEIIVDAYDEYEQSAGWSIFFDETLEFPFTATAQLKKRDGTTESKRVKITGLSSKEDDFMSDDFNLEMEQGQYVRPIAYSALSDIEASEETLEAFQIWDFAWRA